jgi:putative transposase
MDERLRFVARLLEGEKMTELCREFEISRKTGYKIFQRYKDLGLEGLTDRSRRPFRQANKLPMQIETLIVQLKREHPGWGAPKIREKLRRRHDDVQTPAISTVHAVLDRHGLVKHGRKRRYKAQGTGLSQPRRPNDLWCADYKGEFMLGDRRYCYPLTITDFASRYLLSCEALGSTQEAYAFTVPAGLSPVRPAQGHPHRQRRPLRQRPGAVRLEQAIGLVAASGHRHRAHQARASAAERPS